MPRISVEASECRKEPNDFSGWFPRGHLKLPLPKTLADDPAYVEERAALSRCLAGAVLQAFDEPPLSDGTHSEALRVIWMPSFRQPMVIRLERYSGGVTAVIKGGQDEREHGLPYWSKQRELSEEYFTGAIAATERANCWGAGHTCSAEVGINPGIVHVDGETWILEGARRDVHWGVEVHEPPAGPFREAVQAVLRAAGAETDRRR